MVCGCLDVTVDVVSGGVESFAGAFGIKIFGSEPRYFEAAEKQVFGVPEVNKLVEPPDEQTFAVGRTY